MNQSRNFSCLVNQFLEQHNNRDFVLLYREKLAELEKLKFETSNIPNILLIEVGSENFLAAFLAGIVSEVNIFICNPNWQKQEWEEVFNLVKPDRIWGNLKIKKLQNKTIISNRIPYPIIAIPTGGTSGKIRFAMHTFTTLAASVTGFADYFKTNNINSCCILPLYHVSGLMQFLRSFLTKGKFVSFSYSDLKQDKKPAIDPQEFFISLVPTQLQFLLDKYPQWLSQFHTVLLGGAPAWQSLLQQARKYKISLSLTYGMTETASGIVILKSQDFIRGNLSNGKILPHGKVHIINPQGDILPTFKRGIIKITSESLFLGYYPKLSTKSYFLTDDLGFFDDKGYLHLIGRNSHKIITGGENVFPSEVESAILATGLVADVCVIGIPDQKWGEAVTAILVPQKTPINTELIRDSLRSRLSSYKLPKYWIFTTSLSRNQQGKINLTKITALAQNNLLEQE